MKRLTWTPGQYTSHQGHAGRFHLFTIAWKSRREDPDWIMRSYLPQVSGEWKDNDKGVLEAKAEEILDRWLAEVSQGGGDHEGTDSRQTG